MQLVYRAQTFNCTLASQPYVQPNTVNWRYQVAGQNYGGAVARKSFIAPRAVNWRYRMAEML